MPCSPSSLVSASPCNREENSRAEMTDTARRLTRFAIPVSEVTTVHESPASLVSSTMTSSADRGWQNRTETCPSRVAKPDSAAPSKQRTRRFPSRLANCEQRDASRSLDWRDSRFQFSAPRTLLPSTTHRMALPALPVSSRAWKARRPRPCHRAKTQESARLHAPLRLETCIDPRTPCSNFYPGN